jgi:hypothetical protein
MLATSTDGSGDEHRSYPEEEASVSMASRQHLRRGRRRRAAALSGVAAGIVLGGFALADPAAAVGPYATCTASPPEFDAPPMEPRPSPQVPSPYLYDDTGEYPWSSTWRACGYIYPY